MKTSSVDTTCPVCGFNNTAQTSFGNASPSDGDFAICLQCSYVSCYCISGDRITVRRHTPEEAQIMAAHTELQRILKTIASIAPQGRSAKAVRSGRRKH